MKKAKFLFACLSILFGFSSCVATLDASPIPYPSNAQAQGTYRGSVPFIFVEQGVEFAIYPNGEFDFAYVGHNYRQNPYRNSRRSFSYNAGYNYDMYLQFDRFGAVIQVENVPIYYDYYGRITQAGSVNFRYIGDLVSQIGNMHILYERGNVYVGSSGYVNSFNINIRVRPWHSYYVVPRYHVLYTTPYRKNYKPVRYSYVEHTQKYNNRGRNNYDNGRREFIDPITQAPRRGESINGNRDTNNNTTIPNRGRENATNSRDQNTPQVRPGRENSTNNNTGREQTTNRREEGNNQARPTRGNSTNNSTRETQKQSNTKQTNRREKQTPKVRENSRTKETNTPASTNNNRGRNSANTQNNRGR